MQFIIKHISFCYEHTPYINSSSLPDAYSQETTIIERQHPMTRYDKSGTPYKSPSWEEWLEKGVDHQAYDVNLKDTPYEGELFKEFGYEYSRKVVEEFWYTDIYTLDDLLNLIKKYNVELCFDNKEFYILERSR